MLEDIVVVQSAVSAFNNMALWTPAFLFYALLMTPLFVMVYFYGSDFVGRMGWTSNNMLARVSLTVVVFIFAWVVLFGGNYGVLRDNMSMLPILNALILFLCSLFISSHVRSVKLPLSGWRLGVALVILFAVVGGADTHVWWGPLLQMGAVLLGGLIGVLSGAQMRPVSGAILIILTCVVAVLMQPEYFRFGQLGNLTVVHLLTIGLLGMFAVGALIAYNVKPSGRVRAGVYVKLKWLLRVMCALCFCLFILTEAVPVYIVNLIVFAMLFALSVWHKNTMSESVARNMFGVMLFVFGVMTVMPVVSALGIVFVGKVKAVDLIRDIKALL